MRSEVARARSTFSWVIDWGTNTVTAILLTSDVGISMGAGVEGVFLTLTPGRTSTSGRSGSPRSSALATTNTSGLARTLRSTASRRFSITLSSATFVSMSLDEAMRGPEGA